MNTKLISLIALCLGIGACMASEEALDPVEPLLAEPLRAEPDDAPSPDALGDCTVEEPESEEDTPRARGVTDPHYRAPSSVEAMMAALDVPVTEADLAPLRAEALDHARTR